MKNDPQVVVIVLPVYNGEKSVERMLLSLLQQDYKKIQICVVDNCSTDSTPAIISRFSDSDDRIKYFRNERNIGMVKNFNRAFEIASAINPAFFMWASHDDYYDKVFIQEAVEKLIQNPTVVLVTSQTSYRGDGKELFVDVGETIIDKSPMKRFAQYRRLLDRDGYVGSLFHGVIRFDAIRDVYPFTHVLCSDHIHLLDLVLKGSFITIEKKSFYKSYGGASSDLKGLMRSLEVKGLYYNKFPYFNRELMISSVVWGSRMSFTNKVGSTLYSAYCYLRYSILRNEYRSFKGVTKRTLLRLGLVK